MKTIRILGLGVAAAAVALLLSMSHASAQPVAGAYYAGEITGCGEPPCGTVDFTVSGDGLEVEDFTAYDVPGNVCEFQGQYPFPFDLDIVDDSFGPGLPGLYEVSGSFPSEGSAAGTLRLVNTNPPCDTGVLDWTAITTTPCRMSLSRRPAVTSLWQDWRLRRWLPSAQAPGVEEGGG